MKKNQPILTVKDLVKRYGNKLVVDQVSFSVNQGEIFGILGPNGAGKTTTLEMIETLRPIDGGVVELDGIDVAKYPNKVRSLIGVQTQTSEFYDRVSLEEHLNLFARFYYSEVDAADLLGKVQLTDKAKSYPDKLSGGQRQRFSIAMALVNRPKFLFLDEPTTGLDPQARRNLWDLIRDIQKQGITILLTTHYMEEAQMLCDRIAIMDEGKIVALDKPKKLIDNLLATGFKKPVEVQQADLEDVFITLTGKALRE